MEEDFKQLPFGSDDQLYHILKTDSFTFCLICLEDINGTCDGVGQHLTSANHTECIKRLLIACNPSLLYEIENERFADIVSRSVFDISVLLGKETCYVSRKDGFWFCLMCEKSITKINGTDVTIKCDIIDHILSDSHVQNVKEVCFLYRLNANQDFLLLNKSVVYCSVCKEVMQCKELDLLKTVVVHLEMKHTNHAMNNGFHFEESIAENIESKTTEQGFLDERMSDGLNTQNIFRAESVGEVEGDEHLNELSMNTESSVDIVEDISMRINAPIQEKYICICLLCRSRVKVMPGQSRIISINSHFQKSHKKKYFEIPLENIMNFVTFHNDPDKIKLINGSRRIHLGLLKLIRKNRDITNSFQYILKTTTDYVCILCMVIMSPCSDGKKVLIERIQDHFNCYIHRQCIEEHIKLTKVLNINMNNEIKEKLTEQREKLKEEAEVEKKQRRQEKQASKRKLKNITRMKLEVKPESN